MVVAVTVTVSLTVEVLGFGVTVFMGPRRQLQAELIFAVNGFPLPQFAPSMAGMAIGTARLLLLPPAWAAREGYVTSVVNDPVAKDVIVLHVSVTVTCSAGRVVAMVDVSSGGVVPVVAVMVTI